MPIYSCYYDASVLIRIVANGISCLLLFYCSLSPDVKADLECIKNLFLKENVCPVGIYQKSVECLSNFRLNSSSERERERERESCKSKTKAKTFYTHAIYRHLSYTHVIVGLCFCMGSFQFCNQFLANKLNSTTNVKIIRDGWRYGLSSHILQHNIVVLRACRYPTVSSFLCWNAWNPR